MWLVANNNNYVLAIFRTRQDAEKWAAEHGGTKIYRRNVEWDGDEYF